MKVILFGATGMVGQGVLRECLVDPEVRTILSVGRSTTGLQNKKLRELVHTDFLDYSAIESQLAGFDACFFCLGVSSAGLSEERYRHLTYDITLAAARTLAPLNPEHDLRLRLRRRYRQFRARPQHVGAGEGQN